MVAELKEEKQLRWKMEDDVIKATEANRRLREMLEEKKTQLKEVSGRDGMNREIYR